MIIDETLLKLPDESRITTRNSAGVPLGIVVIPGGLKLPEIVPDFRLTMALPLRLMISPSGPNPSPKSRAAAPLTVVEVLVAVSASKSATSIWKSTWAGFLCVLVMRSPVSDGRYIPVPETGIVARVVGLERKATAENNASLLMATEPSKSPIEAS